MTDTMGKFGTHSMGNIATFFISTLKNKPQTFDGPQEHFLLHRASLVLSYWASLLQFNCRVIKLCEREEPARPLHVSDR